MRARREGLTPARHEGLGDLTPARLEGLLARSPAAWRWFLRRYTPLLWRTIRRVAPGLPAQDVADLAQETITALLAGDMRALRAWRPGPARFEAWLTMLAARRAVDHLRSWGAQRRAAPMLQLEDLDPDEHIEALRDPGGGPELAALQLDANRIAGRLAPGYRQWLEVAVEGLESSEAAAIHGTTVSLASKARWRALEALTARCAAA